jgi:hypothetical protein
MSGETSVVFCLSALEDDPPRLYIPNTDQPKIEGHTLQVPMTVSYVTGEDVIPPRIHFKIERGSTPGSVRMPVSEYEAVVLHSVRVTGILPGEPGPRIGEKYAIPLRVETVSDLPRASHADMYEVVLTLDGERSRPADELCGPGGGVWLNLRRADGDTPC